jgi:hypothetical protein
MQHGLTTMHGLRAHCVHWARATALLGLAVAAVCMPARAEVIYTELAAPLTTPFNPAGGNADGTGVWFNPLTGYAEQRGFFFPDPLYADGQFFLLSDTFTYGAPQAQVFVQGFFSRGNGVIYASADNLNPAQFAEGDVIGPGVGLQSPGAGFPDMGPLFGNWAAGDRGFLGLTLRDPAGASSSDVFYGFADITVNADYTLTLNAFAYENVPGVAITAVPEPRALVLMAAGLALVGAALRRRRG